MRYFGSKFIRVDSPDSFLYNIGQMCTITIAIGDILKRQFLKLKTTDALICDRRKIEVHEANETRDEGESPRERERARNKVKE